MVAVLVFPLINEFVRKLRISLFCFSYSALVSACHLSFSLLSFLKLPNFVKQPFIKTFSAEFGCNA